MKNIFLTGEKGIGKSTIINRVIQDLNLSFGGYITERQVVGNIKSFSIKSLKSGNLYPIASVDLDTLEKNINTDNFKYHIPDFLKKDIVNSDVIILDELGFMEKDIESFTETIYKILDSDKLVLGVIKDFDCEFLNQIRKREDCTIIRLNINNRDSIYGRVLKLIRAEIL